MSRQPPPQNQNQIPSRSPSPSRSSLRRPSVGGSASTPTRPKILLPSPRFEETEPEAEGEIEAETGEEEEEEGAPGAGFQPFFTLIEDTVTNEHYHPTVHYVFADDEAGAEVVGEGVLRALQRLEGVADADADADDEQTNGREHVLILDVDVKAGGAGGAGAGYEVTGARSLSCDWQVVGTGVSSAPTMDPAGVGGEGEGGLMLKISGRGWHGSVGGEGRMREGDGGRESLEDMVARFQRGLEDVRKMVDVGDVGGGEAHEGLHEGLP